MAYASWSVVFGEQPSAAKWNILGTNDASFNDGTGIADSKILPRHLLTGTGSTNWVWSAWTPTYSASGGGTLTTVTGSGRFIQVGKVVFFHIKITVTNIGTGTGTLQFTLPVTAQSATVNTYIGNGREVASTGVTLAISTVSTTQASLNKYDNGAVLTNGYAPDLIGMYEAA